MSICWANVPSPGLRVNIGDLKRDRASPGQNRPVNPDDPLVGKLFQRFGKSEVSRAFSFFETYDAKICPAIALQDRHDSIVLQLRLKVPVGGWFLPKRVNLGFAGFFHDLRKPRCFNFEQLHW